MVKKKLKKIFCDNNYKNSLLDEVNFQKKFNELKFKMDEQYSTLQRLMNKNQNKETLK
jgi:hypothetical protein